MTAARRTPEGGGDGGAGINVIGHVSGNLGLGVVARNLVELAQSLGRPVAVFDLEAGSGRSGHDLRHQSLAVPSLAELPHAINVFVVGLAAVEAVLDDCPPDFFDGSRLNAIVCFWELPTLPRRGVAALERMDVVVAATDYMEATYRAHLSRAWVVPGRIPVRLPARTEDWDRAAHGIAPDATLYVCGFEPASDPNRKNPFAVIEAFKLGVGDRTDCHLVVRINNAVFPDGTPHGVVARVRGLIAGHPRIHVLTGPMSYPAVLGLYRQAQVYVSLHRAEGLGLGMAEAMLMGRPVIATGWSGNTSFMSHTSACLVGYRMTAAKPTVDAYADDAYGGAGAAHWADPRLDDAAAWMRLLAQSEERRQAVAGRGLAKMLEFNRHAEHGAFIDELEVLHDNRRALAAAWPGHRQTEGTFSSVLEARPSALRRAWWRLHGALRRG